MTNTHFIGKVYYRFDELPSTNDYAAHLIANVQKDSPDVIAKSKPPEGTVVRADSQSAGRGQFGSKWTSAAGLNLTLSVILYPHWLKIEAQFDLNMAVALALHDTCAALGALAPCALKWPNDLYFGDRKCAGILIQNNISGQTLQSAVVGIGLNVNQTAFDASLSNATSLALETGNPLDLSALEQALFQHLETRYGQLKAGKTAELKMEYTESLYQWNRPAQYRRSSDGVVFTGIIRGVARDGRLRMEIAGEEVLFNLKEVMVVLG
jgi:BirA family biotin operon repressor/biotin-[acetyl-CoA-carboxylase] ligase